jgi:translation initiation factor IF-1
MGIRPLQFGVRGGPDAHDCPVTKRPDDQICVFDFYVAQCLSEERIASRLSKDDLIDMQGTVVAVHSGGLYRVQCDAGHEVLAQLSGRMRRFRIKVVPGDRVTVGVSPYDPVRGIITFRAR